jgi:hypothetical protein
METLITTYLIIGFIYMIIQIRVSEKMIVMEFIDYFIIPFVAITCLLLWPLYLFWAFAKKP